MIMRALRKLKPKSINYKGVVLPARNLRYCGSEFQSDQIFLNTAIHEVRRLESKLGLSKDTRILDVGCGVGRLAIGLLSAGTEINEYIGVDVSKKSIAWCNQYLGNGSANYQFVHLDVQNERYNPSGRQIQEDSKFPFESGSFDIVYLYSVFSHMALDDIQTYLDEFHRLLRANGQIFLTAFIEDDVPEITENPSNYRMAWKGPLHCMRFNREFFDSVLYHGGFVIKGFDYATETDGQSAYYLQKSEA